MFLDGWTGRELEKEQSSLSWEQKGQCAGAQLRVGIKRWGGGLRRLGGSGKNQIG